MAGDERDKAIGGRPIKRVLEQLTSVLRVVFRENTGKVSFMRMPGKREESPLTFFFLK